MASHPDLQLSRRERQIMDAVYRLSQASVNDVLAEIPDPPSYSAVRALMRILEDKGHLKHRVEKGKFIYQPTRPRHSAAKAAMKRVLETFFAGSTEQAIAALLDASQAQLSNEQLDRVRQLIEQARNEGR